MEPPSVHAAIAAGFRALAVNLWLAPVGMLLALVTRALSLAPFAYVVLLAARAFRAGLAAHPADPAGAIASALRLLASPPAVIVGAALWLSGTFLAAALRVAFLAGALPTLGQSLARAEARPAFASGVAFAFPRVAATAVLSWVARIAGDLMALAFAGGSVLVSLRAFHSGRVVLAGPVAVALTLAVLVPFALSILGDAALARSALRGEAPAQAIARAAARFFARPAAFLLAGMTITFLGVVLVGSAETLTRVATGAAPGLPLAAILAGELLVAALSGLLGTVVELWRLGTLAALAGSEET